MLVKALNLLVSFAVLFVSDSSTAQLIYSSASRGINIAAPASVGGGLEVPVSLFADFEASRSAILGSPNAAGEVPSAYVYQRSILRTDRIEADAVLRAQRPLGAAFFPSVSEVSAGSNVAARFSVSVPQPFAVYYDAGSLVGGQGRATIGMELTDLSTSSVVFGISPVTPTPSGPFFGTLLPGRTYSLSFGAAALDLIPSVSPVEGRVAFRMIVPTPSTSVIVLGALWTCARRRRTGTQASDTCPPTGTEPAPPPKSTPA